MNSRLLRKTRRAREFGHQYGAACRVRNLGLEDVIRYPYTSDGFGVARRTQLEAFYEGWWLGFMGEELSK